MNQLSLFIDKRTLFEKLCSTEYLKKGFRVVKRNKGAPGIDGVKIEDFTKDLEHQLLLIQEELRNWKYKPKPVKRVEIAKPGKKDEKRLLGIPCVKDRVIQSTLKILLEPIFDPEFSDSSYGFRPKRSQRDAVEAAQGIIKSGKEFVVDIDLSKFFDRVNHDRLINRLSLKITDKRILRIIGMILRSGIMKNGLVSSTREGTVQGGPLSPLLSNVVLDELDKELEKRGLEFCRYADDCNIFVGSNKAANRIMASISKFIETKLKLKINQEKSQVALSRFVRFLGMTIIAGTIVISQVSMARANTKLKSLVPHNSHKTIVQTMREVNSWYRGWSNYYSMTNIPAQLKAIEARTRRRFRAKIISQHKRKKFLVRTIRKRGIRSKAVFKSIYCNKGRWALSHVNVMNNAYPIKWFTDEIGQFIRSSENREHWSDLKRWIKIV